MTKAVTTPASPLDSFQPLAKYDNGGYERPDTLACISAGYKTEAGVPVVSRDGTIYISDPEKRAPGLAKLLAANNHRRLTIAMPSNNPADFISQSYRKESKTRLEAFGDDKSITTISPEGERLTHDAGTPAYEALVLQCKISTNITFILAEYDQNGQPVLIFPDGIGCYRMRTTSANTVGNLLACLKLLAKFTGGSYAGLPLETSLVYRNVSDPKGAKRNVPLFVFALKPPATVTLSSQTFGGIAAAAREAIGMCLPALPAPMGIDEAIAEFDELPPAAVNALATGLDSGKVRATFFAITKDTWADNDAQRRVFMDLHTEGATQSLATFLETATPETADELLESLRAHVEHMAPEATKPSQPAPVRLPQEPIDAEYTEVEPMATKEEIGALWAAVQACEPELEQAKEVLMKCLKAFGRTKTAELTRAECLQSTDHYRAHAAQNQAA